MYAHTAACAAGDTVHLPDDIRLRHFQVEAVQPAASFSFVTSKNDLQLVNLRLHTHLQLRTLCLPSSCDNMTDLSN